MGGIKTRKARLLACERQNWKCYWCGVKMVDWIEATGKIPMNAATLDHIYPRGQRPKHGRYNNIAACYKCNTKRGKKTFQQMVKEVYGNTPS